ncbi:hypothetical protein CDL12_04476 [Handroanthus impetiginosus]|uniref:Uncharacterized protein n=1 Tax=Handroanthus impetiginosus TaxID=429701 RepID=A0A2G9HZN7_9LAMI|nr:hypothetical protein CDL12_04476 [Handroanthus impetiginosus]
MSENKFANWFKSYVGDRVEVEETLEVAYQNDMVIPVDTIMLDELCENMLNHSHPIENVNESELLHNDGAISDDVEDKVECDEDEDELGDK